MRAFTRQAGWRAPALVTGFLFAHAVLSAEPKRVDVCQAVKGIPSNKGAAVVIHGSGQVVDEGLVIDSESCPIARTGYDQIGTAILVKVTSFATPEARSRFLRAEAERGGWSPILDVEVRGVLECRTRMRFIRSGPDILGANGFGPYGLCKCTMNTAELRMVVDSKVQPEPRRRPPVPK